jgi:adaptin ear-binding coat-associated protein 1/2
MNRDPITNAPLPPTAIQRILYLAAKVHIYRIPPIHSTKGFNAASWTQNPADNIFNARMRIVETAIPAAKDSEDEKVTVNILLEDPASGELFAAAPYTSPTAVEQALDSSRFFAIRVVGGGGQKATLGIGFEERPEAFDFGVALQDVRRTLKMDGVQAGSSAGKAGGAPQRAGASKTQQQAEQEPKRDFSLKEGEMITINIGGKGRRHASGEAKTAGGNASGGNPFAIAPPPAGGGSSMAFLPPPPSASAVRAERSKRFSQEVPKQLPPSAEDLGFDDGEFGEFQ